MNQVQIAANSGKVGQGAGDDNDWDLEIQSA